MEDKNKAPQNGYSVDEILAEAHIIKDKEKAVKSSTDGNVYTDNDLVRSAGGDETGKNQPEKQRRPANVPLTEEKTTEYAEEALKSEIGKMDSNGNKGMNSDKKVKKKKNFFSFLKRDKYDEEDDEEDDPYYGLQLKPLSEYRKDYENTMKIDIRNNEKDENNDGGDTGMPENMDETFRRVHEERRKRLEKIMRQAGMEPDELLSENGKTAGSSEDEQACEGPRGEAPEADGLPAVPPEIPPQKPDTEKEPDIAPPSGKPEYTPPKPPEIKKTVNKGEKTRGTAGGPFSDESDTVSKSLIKDSSNKVKDKKGQLSDELESIQSKDKTASEAPDAKSGVISEKNEKPNCGSVKEPVKVPYQKDGEPVPPPVKEPEKIPHPQYRTDDGLPVSVLDFNMFEEAIIEEAKKYDGADGDSAGAPPAKNVQNIRKSEMKDPQDGEEDKNGGDTSHEIGSSCADSDNTIEFPKTFEHDEPEHDKEPEEPGQQDEPHRTKKHFRIFGTEEPDSGPAEEEQKYEKEIDDYNEPGDAPSILNDLAGNLSKLFLRLIASGIALVLMLVFSIAYEHQALLPAGIHKVYTSQVFLIIQLIFLLIASAFSFPAISNGIKGLFQFKINSDSAVSVAAAAAVIQNIVLLANGMPADASLYSVIAAGALFFNTAGKFSMEKRIFRNFKFVSSNEEKYAVQIFGDHNTALKLARGCVIGEPQIAYETHTKFLKNFLHFSYIPDPGERTSQSVGVISIIASLVLCAAGFILTKNVIYAIDSLTAAICISVPFMNMLSVNMPVSRLCSIAAKNGAMVSGWQAIESFSETNAVMVDDKDLFPKGTVILNGIKTFAGQRIDEAILDATALVCTVGGPLSDVFSQIIKNRQDILPKAESVLYIDGKGITGLVDGKKILVGNRKLIKDNGIEPPSHDYEKKYIESGREVIYLASEGCLTAMFTVLYRSARRRAAELRRMENDGISLIIRTRDPNITPELVSRCFGVSANSVSVLSDELGNVYAGLQAQPPDREDALIATKGHVTSMMRVLTACVRQRGNISIAVALQNTGAILGLALAALFICTFGLKELSATSLIIFETFWAAAVTFIPRLRRP